MNKRNRFIQLSLYSCIIGIVLFLVLNRHSRAGYFNYHSEIWSDKAGYFVYLPAAFKYNFDPGIFPDSIVAKTGYGFILNQEKDVVQTKYTYGVALLQLPFFLLADLFAPVLDYERSGFSPIYHWSINIASVFYLLLGLFLLGKYLIAQFKPGITYFVLLSLFLGTNLFYYAIDETGMSHIYSFALFSSYLYLLRATQFLNKTTLLRTCLLGFIGGLIVLIRPSNIIFLLCYFFLDLNLSSDILMRAKRIFKPRTLLPLLLCSFIVLIPQFIYWKYANGSFLSYSYGKEGFNWSQPKIIESLFSPYNGLLPNTPLYLIVMLSICLMVKNRENNGAFLLICFVVISYVFSCWWDRSFGCAFGARSYVEYHALFSIALAYFYTRISVASKTKKISFCLLVLMIIALNLKMTYTYDGCFPGTHDWDWEAYTKIISSEPK